VLTSDHSAERAGVIIDWFRRWDRTNRRAVSLGSFTLLRHRLAATATLVGAPFVIASFLGGVGWESVLLEISAGLALVVFVLLLELRTTWSWIHEAHRLMRSSRDLTIVSRRSLSKWSAKRPNSVN
jgi:MFS family permease